MLLLRLSPSPQQHTGLLAASDTMALFVCVCVCCGWQVEVGGGGGALDQVTAAATTSKETADEGAPPQQVNSKCLQ